MESISSPKQAALVFMTLIQLYAVEMANVLTLIFVLVIPIILDNFAINLYALDYRPTIKECAQEKVNVWLQMCAPASHNSQEPNVNYSPLLHVPISLQCHINVKDVPMEVITQPTCVEISVQ